jgi:site-specific DNA-methyltransferase (adenine-specific)
MDLRNANFFSEIESIPSGSVDLIFADPPYFLSNGGMSVLSGRQVKVDKGSWDQISGTEGSHDFHDAWISKIRRIMKADGSIVISGTYHSIYQCALALEVHGFRVLGDIVWFKPNGAPNLSGRRLAASHETLIWASKSEKSKFTFNYLDLKNGEFPGDKIKKDNRQMRSVWWIPTTPPREKKQGRHPTQKPLALLERVVLAFSRPGNLVLDPFMGSGTTGVACQKLGRRFLGIEKELEFFELANNRIKEAQA